MLAPKGIALNIIRIRSSALVFSLEVRSNMVMSTTANNIPSAMGPILIVNHF